jgi:FkbM family methyltransferase
VLNGLTNIVTVCAAAGDKDGFVKLPMQSERDRSRLSMLEAGPNSQDAFVEVPIRRLDTFIDTHDIGPIQLLKIDVEGFEFEVLRGLGNRIANCRNVILELLDATSVTRNRCVMDMLASAGFELKDVAGQTWQWGMPLVESNLWASRR